MMENIFDVLLASVGSFGHYQGYPYLRQSVLLVREDSRRLCHMQAEIYQPVALQYHTTVSNVHKDIRTVRDSFWNHGGDKRFVEWTGCSRWNYDRPYPKEFIEVLAHALENAPGETGREA